MKRREIIKTTFLASLAPAMTMPSCGQEKPMPIIDTHQHIWDRTRFNMSGGRPPLDRDYLMEDYLKAMDLAPIIDHCIEVFGDERVIFAGDWPVCLMNMPLARWIATLKEVVAGRSPEFRRKLFHDNAERIFKL